MYSMARLLDFFKNKHRYVNAKRRHCCGKRPCVSFFFFLQWLKSTKCPKIKFDDHNVFNNRQINYHPQV